MKVLLQLSESLTLKAKFMNKKYYTLQITFQNGIEVTTTKYQNLAPTDGVPFNVWSKGIRDGLYGTGFNLEISPTVIRFVSPFHIHDAYLILQDNFIKIDQP